MKKFLEYTKFTVKTARKKFIGQTIRKLESRFKEHGVHLKYNQEENSAMVKHYFVDKHEVQN